LPDHRDTRVCGRRILQVRLELAPHSNWKRRIVSRELLVNDAEVPVGLPTLTEWPLCDAREFDHFI